jgi:hypothetical protein
MFFLDCYLSYDFYDGTYQVVEHNYAKSKLVDNGLHPVMDDLAFLYFLFKDSLGVSCQRIVIYILKQESIVCQ